MHNHTQNRHKTRQKHRYNKIPLFRSISFPIITLSYICFLSMKSIIFRATVKSFLIFCACCMVIDSFQKRSIMNMQLRQCFPETSFSDWKKARFCLAFFISKTSQMCSKKARISKSGFTKAELATVAAHQLKWQHCWPQSYAYCYVTVQKESNKSFWIQIKEMARSKDFSGPDRP